jgi:hypothetical protein
LVERRIEEVHRRIKLIGAKSTHIMPPYVCALLREVYHINMLKASGDFHNFCVDNWRRKNLLNSVLHLRLPKAKMALMSTTEKVEFVYQSALESEFSTTKDARQAQKSWLAEKTQFAVSLPQIPSAWQACVQYWKSTMVEGAYYSLPSSVYEAARNRHDHVFGGFPDPLQASLEVADQGLQEFDIGSDYVVFRLVKVSPEKRYHVSLPHIASSSTMIHVSR